MSAIDDVKAQLVEVQRETTENGEVIQSAVTAFQGLSAIIAALKDQLANAGTDPAKLQEVKNGLTTLETTLDTQSKALGAAIVANTPAA